LKKRQSKDIKKLNITWHKCSLSSRLKAQLVG
jgi:hypothetical protein